MSHRQWINVRWRGRASHGVIIAVIVVVAAGIATFASLRAGRGPLLSDARERLAAFTGLASIGRSHRELRTQIVRSYPHDPDAFTQGLLLEGQVLYESTGLVGRSSLRRIDLQSGRVLNSVALPQEVFGEGLASVPGLLIQLTWKDQVAFVYDTHSLELRRRIAYAGEGWGLCFDGSALVMSDGSNRLTHRHPDSLAIQRTVDVTMDGVPLRKLNELECVGDSVYANVWRTDMIVRIESATGRVVERIDASGLLTAPERQAADVLNGIAYDPSDGTFFITGKLWPKLFKVRFAAGS